MLKEELAGAGFFYIGPDRFSDGPSDRVQCAFCDLILKEWQLGDVPDVIHRSSSDCTFIVSI